MCCIWNQLSNVAKLSIIVHSKRQRNASIRNFLPNNKIILVGQENVLLILYSKIRLCSRFTLTLWLVVRPCPQNAVPCKKQTSPVKLPTAGWRGFALPLFALLPLHIFSQTPAAQTAQASSVLTPSFCVLAHAARIYTFAWAGNFCRSQQSTVLEKKASTFTRDWSYGEFMRQIMYKLFTLIIDTITYYINVLQMKKIFSL